LTKSISTDYYNASFYFLFFHNVNRTKKYGRLVPISIDQHRLLLTAITVIDSYRREQWQL